MLNFYQESIKLNLQDFQQKNRSICLEIHCQRNHYSPSTNLDHPIIINYILSNLFYCILFRLFLIKEMYKSERGQQPSASLLNIQFISREAHCARHSPYLNTGQQTCVPYVSVNGKHTLGPRPYYTHFVSTR